MRWTRTEEGEDSEHVGPLLEYLPMDCVRHEAVCMGIRSEHMRTCARVRHSVEVISQLLYALDELCARSVERGHGLKLFLLLEELCGSSRSVRDRTRQLRLARRSHRSTHDSEVGGGSWWKPEERVESPVLGDCLNGQNITLFGLCRACRTFKAR